MTTLKPYPTYKDSGVDWLDDIPAHWSERRGKALSRKLDRPVEPGAETVTCFRDGTVTLRRNRRTTGFTETIQEIGYQGVKRGDLVIHAMDAFAGAVGVSVSDGKCSPVYSICGPIGNADPHYYARVVREMARNGYIQAQAKGIRERSTDFRFEGFGRAMLPVPPLDEQRAIADFLDGMDARITRFIAARRKMIALLEEKKQAVINQAVTRGLDPAVSMKDSGVDWLGEVPAHWEVKRGAALFTERNETGYPDLPILEVSLITGVTVRDLSDPRRKQMMSDRSGYKRALSGDLPYNMMRMWQGAVGAAPVEGLVSPAYVVLAPRAKTNSDYYAAIFRTPNFMTEVSRNSKGIVSDRDRLYWDSFKQLQMPYPPLPEQERIVAHIDRESSRVDMLISRHRREIELMQEYRTRLISDVVTGKLDVRGVELPAVEEVVGEEIEAAMEAEPVEEFEEIEA